LANAGYRCVLLDLRGHGQSSGKQLGYGRREALDVVEAIAQLRARKILTGRSALIGFSYGGGIALMAAARGAQTDVVVAVAPFAELHDVAGNFASELGGWLGWFSSPGLVASTLQLAGERGGFDAHRDSPLGAASAVQVPVLLIHGTKDTLVPLDESRKLQAALAGPTTLRTVAGRDHVELVYDAGLSLPVMLPWLADHLAPGAYGLLDHALVAWKGREPLSPFHATWAVRQQPTAEIHDWPRPAGGRCLRTWFQVPPAWLGRDLDLELGTIDGRDEAWLGAVRLGGMNELQPSPIPLLRRYRVPAWAVTAQCELSLLLISDHADAGLHWLCASTGLIRPASP
jgi:alpha/beta superfamily hydrolase